MNRKYTRERYENLIAKLKSAIPEIAITTDCLVGFPGENEVHFENTVDLIRKIMPLKVHVFGYSSRPGTPAANFRGIVSPEVIRQRCSHIAEVAKECSKKFRQRFINQKVDVLIEGQVKDNTGQLEGLTDNYLKVKLPFRPGLSNIMVCARLKSIQDDSFVGEYIDPAPSYIKFVRPFGVRD